ncbi:hypothetical protein [Rathayibacter soli]|uniref:hypothetical protein n=1 Tax=Rathayibacter soli TaxID=3144168 RepID=UPI0027E53D46|nr:hypothetical protein [Glaciibacter superstes]
MTTPRSTASSTPTARPTASATPAPTAVSLPDATQPTRIISSLDANTAWRAATGACPATPGTLQGTSDAGATWKNSDAARPAGASAIIRLSVQSATQIDAVALAAAGCAPEFIRSYVNGDNWATYPTQLAGTWYFNPANAAVVHSPQGDKPAPCPTVVGLAPRDATSAAVLCSNHTVFRTADAGATWGAATTVTGAVAISSSGAGYAAASVGVTDCAGISLAALDAASSQPSTAGCFVTAAPAAGAVALSDGAGTLWLWAGDALARSGDQGKTWH